MGDWATEQNWEIYAFVLGLAIAIVYLFYRMPDATLFDADQRVGGIVACVKWIFFGL